LLADNRLLRTQACSRWAFWLLVVALVAFSSFYFPLLAAGDIHLPPIVPGAVIVGLMVAIVGVHMTRLAVEVRIGQVALPSQLVGVLASFRSDLRGLRDEFERHVAAEPTQLLPRLAASGGETVRGIATIVSVRPEGESGHQRRRQRGRRGTSRSAAQRMMDAEIRGLLAQPQGEIEGPSGDIHI